MTPDLKELTRRLRETPPNVLKEREAAAAIDSLIAELEQAKKDAERYKNLRRGQKWSVINGIGDALTAEALDSAIDAKEQT